MTSESATDIVYIRDLRVDTIIGIFDWEREVRQTVSLDLEMAADIRRVAKRLIAFIEASQFLLVERLAEEVANIVIDEFGVPWLRLRLSKPGALRGAFDVGLVIERGARP